MLPFPVASDWLTTPPLPSILSFRVDVPVPFVLRGIASRLRWQKKTVLVGGKNDVPQQYCGTVGGQSMDFVIIGRSRNRGMIRFNHSRKNTYLNMHDRPAT